MTGEAASHAGAARGWAGMLAVGTAVLALDQATKALVRGTVERAEGLDLVLGIQIVNVRNQGVAFGLLADAGPVLVVVTLITLAVLIVWFATNPWRPGLWLAIGLLAGGAAGNLLDRLREGEVTDFLDLPAWPAFNVADIAIVAGVLVLVILVLADEPSKPEQAAEP